MVCQLESQADLKAVAIVAIVAIFDVVPGVTGVEFELICQLPTDAEPQGVNVEFINS
jgi:hypothetical protein